MTSTVFIDRFLVTAEAYNIPAVLVFNKTDLYDAEDQAMLGGLTVIYRKIGYPCYAVSAETGEHVDEIRSLLKDKITVLSGLSGVGKSSLVNCIEPGLDLKTAGISDAHDSGKHTTTFAEMFPLKQGGFIIDTPGLRSFGIIDLKKEELSAFFPGNIREVPENAAFIIAPIPMNPVVLCWKLWSKTKSVRAVM